MRSLPLLLVVLVGIDPARAQDVDAFRRRLASDDQKTRIQAIRDVAKEIDVIRTKEARKPKPNTKDADALEEKRSSLEFLLGESAAHDDKQTRTEAAVTLNKWDPKTIVWKLAVGSAVYGELLPQAEGDIQSLNNSKRLKKAFAPAAGYYVGKVKADFRNMKYDTIYLFPLASYRQWDKNAFDFVFGLWQDDSIPEEVRDGSKPGIIYVMAHLIGGDTERARRIVAKLDDFDSPLKGDDEAKSKQRARTLKSLRVFSEMKSEAAIVRGRIEALAFRTEDAGIRMAAAEASRATKLPIRGPY